MGCVIATAMKVAYQLFDEEADLTLAAPCGLYCGNCSIFRTYYDRDQKKANAYAREMKCKPGDVKCSGCRVEAKFRWSPDCEFLDCTEKHGVKFCYQCKDFPCGKITEFADAAPHHREIFDNFERIRAVGWRQWLKEQDERWRCGVCRAKLEFYDDSCPTCGTPAK